MLKHSLCLPFLQCNLSEELNCLNSWSHRLNLARRETHLLHCSSKKKPKKTCFHLTELHFKIFILFLARSL